MITEVRESKITYQFLVVNVLQALHPITKEADAKNHVDRA